MLEFAISVTPRGCAQAHKVMKTPHYWIHARKSQNCGELNFLLTVRHAHKYKWNTTYQIMYALSIRGSSKKQITDTVGPIPHTGFFLLIFTQPAFIYEVHFWDWAKKQDQISALVDILSVSQEEVGLWPWNDRPDKHEQGPQNKRK